MFKGFRLTDHIDIRPRVAPYVLSSKSPFDFTARTFDNDGQYSNYILAPDENLLISYSSYLGRVDRILLNPDGTFEVSQGIPALSPIPPSVKSNTLDIATVFLPPYVYNVKDIFVDMSEHKRYRMSDISLLEKRIQRVEEFTVLTALEAKTESLTIKDAETGLDRFKSGFFVDNFSNHSNHDLNNPSFRTSIDQKTNSLQSTHYTTSLDLQLGSEVISGVGQTFYPNKDHSFVDDLGSLGVKKTGDLITLNYTELKYFEQPYATKTESVTPFLVRYWQGSIELNPPIDSWISEQVIRTNSFNETTNNLPPLPDENITVTNNVNQNRDVRHKEPNTKSSSDAFTRNARKILEDKIAALPSDTQFKIETAFTGDAFYIYASSKQALVGFPNGGSPDYPPTPYTRLGQVETFFKTQPKYVRDQFFAELQRKSDNDVIKFVFVNPDKDPKTTTSTRSNSNTTTKNTSSIIIPPEITSRDTTSESISHYTQPIQFLRSRNIEFDVRGLRPTSRFYSFFEGIDVNQYIVPKLLEIEMISGRFQIGETIESDPLFTTHDIKFRVCSPNHKVGPHNSPTETFGLIPYNQQPPPSDYSETSTFVNVDTRSLQLNSETSYYGLAAVNMKLIGKTSGAVARVANIRLVSDNTGRLIGSLFIPDPNNSANPKWVNGENTFTIIDVPRLDQIINDLNANSRINQSSAETEFRSLGSSNVTEVNVLTTRNVTIIPARNRNVTTITNTSTTTTQPNTTQTGNTVPNVTFRDLVSKLTYECSDPLAQSFYVRDENGIFITSVDIYFETKDDSIPVTLQIRTMSGGVPSNVVLPFSEVTLNPQDVKLSADGSVSTRFTFPSPVYLSGPQLLEVRQAPLGSQQTSEFAIVLLSNSPQYKVFVAELGFNDIQTGVKISQQPTLGGLFKSQNSSTWTPSQLEDLKFVVNRADFTNEGLVRFFNPVLDFKNKAITVTGSNQLLPLSKKVVVGLASTGYSSNVVPGVNLYQDSATGTLAGIAGSIATGSSSLIITNPGSNYENGTYNNQQLITNTGFGRDAIVNVTIAANQVGVVTVVSGGTGYQAGDSLTLPSLGNGLGTGAEFTVSTITTNNTFVIDNVQGSFSAGISTISYQTSSGIVTTVGAGVTVSSLTEDQFYTGRHLKVYHVNHGMHSVENVVRISELRPTKEESNTKLSAAITPNSTEMPLISTLGFDTFENLTVDVNNPGYVIIGDEVISYTGVSGNSLTGIGTFNRSYDSGVSVYQYQFNGVSLRRINKVHSLAFSTDDQHPIDLHSYYIKIETTATSFDGISIGKNRPDLYFNESKQTGDPGTVLTNNIQFESLISNISHIIPAKTNLSTRIRTFSGTSVSGDEVSFIDQGFEQIPINAPVFFANPRIVCSDVNESASISNSPGNKSFTMEFLMNTDDSKVSPVIDTIRTSVILTTNLINSPVGIEKDSNYANDDRVRSLLNDPHAAIYISNPIRLKIPANSIKVLLAASRNETNDIRVLYQLFRDDAPQASNNFELFPGYSNYQVDGQGIKRVVDTSLNDGSADFFVDQTSDRSFKDYEYSVDDLPDFNGFAIKIVMAGKNQATPPIIKDLRAIATVKPRV